MQILLVAILAALALLIILTALILGGKGRADASRFDAFMKEQFLNFQTSLRRDIDSTRQEVSRSKDLISEHTLKTVDTIREMGATIEKIVRQQEDAQRLGQALKDLLQAPKLRGNYGEAVLEEMLERVLPRGVWQRQVAVGGGEKVDAAVKLRDVLIPIDAKFPRDDYQRYMEASSPAEKSSCWKSYEAAVKKQIRSIGEKYVKPEKGTADFALMFIPSEAVYYETIAEKNYLGEPCGLYEYAQQNKVLPVSPNTFYAFLQIVVIGIKNLEMIRGARKLQDGLRGLQRSFDLFYKKQEEIGRELEKAREAYRVGSGHIEKYRDQLDKTLQLEALNGDGYLTEEGEEKHGKD